MVAEHGLLTRDEVRRAGIRASVAGMSALVVGSTVMLGGYILVLSVVPIPSAGIWSEVLPGLLGFLVLPVFPLTVMAVIALVRPARRMIRCPACDQPLRGDVHATIRTGRCPQCAAIIVAGVRPRRLASLPRLRRRQSRRVLRRGMYGACAVIAVSAIAMWSGYEQWGIVAAMGGLMLGPSSAWAWMRTRHREWGVSALLTLAALASVVAYVAMDWP